MVLERRLRCALLQAELVTDQITLRFVSRMNFKERETQQKLRGGYYTPLPIAELLSQWVLEQGARTILEPSCGDGVFLRALHSRAQASGLTPHLALDAVEISVEEAAKSAQAGA